MTITVTNIEQGPYVATGNPQTVNYTFMTLTDSEIDVFYQIGDAPRVLIDPAMHTVNRNRSITGDAVEGGSVELMAEAAPSGSDIWLVASPLETRDIVWSDAGSRLRNLNEEQDRDALRDLVIGRRIDLVASVSSDALTKALEAIAIAEGVVGDWIVLDTLDHLRGVKFDIAPMVYVLGRDVGDGGYFGAFVPVYGDQSANVANDPLSGVWVAPEGQDGSAGAWRRAFVGSGALEWFTNSSITIGEALVAALRVVQCVTLNGGGTIDIPPSGVATFIAWLDCISPLRETTFVLPDGEYSIPGFVELTNPSLINVRVKGTWYASTTLSAGEKISGTGGNYTLRLTVSDTADINIGGYVISAQIVGGKYARAFEGCLKVVAKTPTTVDVISPFQGTFPASDINITTGVVVPVNTVLKWPADSIGVRVSGAPFRELSSVVMVGGFNPTDIGTDHAADGLQVGSSPNTPVTGQNASEEQNSGSIWAARLGVVNFQGNGVQVIGGRFVGVLVSACGNGWRGIQGANTGSATAKWSSAVGNGASGYQSEANGTVNGDYGLAAGNRQQGVYAVTGGTSQFQDGVTILNGQAGLDARNGGFINADAAHVHGHVNGVYAYSGEVLFGSGAVADTNTTDLAINEGGTINATGAASFVTFSYDPRRGDRLIGIDGYLAPFDISWLRHPNGRSVRWNVSSAGALVISNAVSGTTPGSFSSRLLLAADGTLYPFSDGGQNLGRATERWNNVYAAVGTINTSDAREKTEPSTISDEVLDAWGDVSMVAYQWLSSIAEKGEGARVHVGLIAQQVRDAFANRGLDATRYGLLCYDEWEAEPAQYEEGENGEKYLVREAVEAGNRWGIRPDQCLFLEAAYQRRRMDRIEKRLSVL